MVRFLTIAAILAAAVAQAAPASVRSGIEAWQSGDHTKAVSIWRALAQKGDQDAAFNLGQAYRLGRGVPADSGMAKQWFERAARAGHLDAQVSLGLLLFDSGDRAAALAWLKRAADRGEPRALLVTGTALFNGDGLPRDPVRGYAYVSRAAAQGLAPAKTTLAEMDKIIPLAERQKGVALALAAVTAPRTAPPKAGAPKTAAPKPTSSTPAARPKTAVAASSPVPPPASSGGGWRVQLGAFGTRGAAQALFARLGSKLGGAQAYYVPVGAMTRLQAGPYSKADAAATCARLKPQPCFPVSAR